MLDLHLDLDQRTERSHGARLQNALRESVQSGRLRAGTTLPSTRALADDLGVSRNVVVAAYEQLCAEGYLEARRGSGTRVAREARRATTPAPPDHDDAAVSWMVDFTPGLPDLTSFPAKPWKRSLEHAVDTTDRRDLAYAHLHGSPQLRQELAWYLRRVRGADVTADNIVITHGVSASLSLLGRLLRPHSTSQIAVEDPGSYLQRRALESVGTDVVPVPVDDAGIRVDKLPDVDGAVVTPAHQYPTGAVLTAERRTELIAWAERDSTRVVVEDDYDAEFRFDRKPIGAIQGLAPHAVALTGSVSKSLAPALRLGWTALPASLTARAADVVAAEFSTPDVISQNALAHLIATGQYDRIIRKRRATYETRRSRLAVQLADLDGCRIIGSEGGLHLTLLLPEATSDTEIVERLATHRVLAAALSEYRVTPGPPGLVLSYAALTPTQIDDGTRAIRTVLKN